MITGRKIILVLITALVIVGCSSSSDDGPSSKTDDFNRGALLTNLVDNTIIPAFEDLQVKLLALKANKDVFIVAPNQINLEALRMSWIEAYKVWQSVEVFNIGKAEELQYSFQMNVYPTNVLDIENNISSGTYDLTNVNNNDAVGFPAVDYLLYGIGNDDMAILNKYLDIKYKNYLADVIDQMASLTQIVLDDWKTVYRTTFVNSIANTATSSLNKFVNDFIFYYEKGLRANKIGIPAGNFSTTPLPEKIEAFYNQDISKELALEALNAVQNLFNGKAYLSATIGESFKSYLNHLDRNDLVGLINTRFDDARQKIEALHDNFNIQINTDNTKMTQAFDALQLTVVSLKVDMLQAFNVSVDFVDADGD
ncbi:peptidase M75 superfamily protein [Flavivirga aquatica]|uniref:Peptidase M75 superfamily protein n=1 Tax=Flavivirga aquatica TaxID=1849968 RepID=A0A1E5TC05_9FLAO|nr:imelysin family protein [Flavivirga aquatica]OEK08890.1 peptidase M75 superfamily protein [Flavivirga aquatica]